MVKQEEMPEEIANELLQIEEKLPFSSGGYKTRLTNRKNKIIEEYDPNKLRTDFIAKAVDELIERE